MKRSILLTAVMLCMTLLATAQRPGRFPRQELKPAFKDVNYAGDTLEAHRMDIYLPNTGLQRYKVVVAIYGSAWFSNNMKGAAYASIGKPLTDAGFAVVCINHRSSGDAKFPAQIHDVKAALRFIRAHAAEYRLDTSFVGITGFSSGGHLSSLAGVTNGLKQYTVGKTTVDLEGTLGGNLDCPSTVDAVVDWFGPVDMAHMENCTTVKDEKSPEAALIGGAPAQNPDLVALISPVSYVGSNCPPFLVIHGDADTVVPHCQSERFANALKQAGRLEDFVTVPGGEHGPKTFNTETFKQMTDFLKKEADANSRIANPMLWADVPDPDIIRVGDTFYLVSTTMHLMPGAPVMASKDLKNWQTVGYIFDRLTDSPKYDLQEGTVYGRGQWATSLKYHNGKFYALLAPNEGGDMGRTYIFSAEKAEGPWKLVSRMRHFHDCSLFFDDDNRVYVVYGTGDMMELKPDLSDVIEGTHRKIFEREADETGLLEGSRMIKHNGKYYLLMISHVWAPGRHRREVCYRADNITGPYEKNVILESDFGGFSYVGQGTIVDTEDGDWYGIIFQDRGGVGRVLTLSPVRWLDGWPMIGDEQGKVPTTMRSLKSGQPKSAIVCSDDFTLPLQSEEGVGRLLGLHWQWNHNPVDKAWSLTERPGWLRLKTSRVVSNLYLAPNTLTQRMEGPTCSGSVCMDLSKMKDGDCAGFTAFNGDSGVLTVKKQGRKLTLAMSEQSVSLTEREKAVTDVAVNEVESVELKQPKVWLRIDGDFQPGHGDVANFYYSLDGTEWTKIGTADYKMRFDYRRFFMGSKFAIFNYATKKAGGYVDVDFFHYSKQ